ncbi:GATOR2 complex protein WDR59 isoform X2 [Ranitomeya variabilis]|uniref:GATOR2 complex protein WDR59 isoform X2 n=1 Tax=Ranitomeya variabilis TaxID=490064 RepID=UPI0040563597
MAQNVCCCFRCLAGKMAAHWSSENVVVEFRDSQATAMSVDCQGQLAVLSGRRFLYIVNLETPSEGPRKISRQSKWDIGTVQWNPHDSYTHFFAASSNQRVDLYQWKDGSGDIATSLQGHTRVISDLDWSVYEPDILVTSSIDTYIYIWDIKDTRKPAVSLSAVAGASQVKWNKKNANCLATSHDGDVRIWDRRKPSTAVEYIAAHLYKIHGVDWHPDNEYVLATSSQDNSVKFWDSRQPRKCLSVLACQVPVWKARYTPFSNGLVTVMVPQLRRENSLLMWNIYDLHSPVHIFVGHDDVVLEFQWRKQKEGLKDYQLVTWSRDQTLRMWRVDAQLQRLCATDLMEPVDELMDGSLMPEQEKSLQPQEPITGPSEEEVAFDEETPSTPIMVGSSEQPGLPQTLQQEFSLINVHIRNVNIEMDATNRNCTVSVHCGNHRVRMVVMFPVQYPNNAAPTFQFVNPTTITSPMKVKLLKILRDTSLQKVKRNQSCLEPCLRQLVSCLESFVNQESSPSSNPYTLQSPVTPPLPTFARVSNAYGSYQDANIPFPRTSGARFCGAGYLVYFTRPMTIHKAISPTEPTPRSLSALSAYHSGVIAPMKIRTETQGNLRLYSGSPTRSEKEQVSISSFYYKERTPPMSARRRWSIQVINDFPKSRRWKSKRESSDSGSRPIKAAGKVIIQDISCLLSVHKALGEMYILNRGDLLGMCQKNAASALSVGRRDLVQVWALAAAANDSCLTPKSEPDSETPWARHPFGRQMLESLLAHYCHLHDVQTLAMLCSVFDANLQPQSSALSSCHPFPSRSTHSRYPSFTSSGSGSSTSDPGFSNSGWSIGGPDGDHAVPWGDASPDDYRYSNLSCVDPREREREQHDKNKRILDPANTQQFDDFKKCYGEILYRWGLQEKRAEVLKFVSCPPEPHRGIEFGVYCSHCRSEVRGTQCAICKGFTFQCAICHVAVRGSSNFCLSCGHGGHTAHMLEWFSSQEVCPTGCGCHCLLESTF